MTKRERMERLVKELQAVGDACDAKGDVSAEDLTKIKSMSADIKQMREELLAEAEATSTLAEAKSFLTEIGVQSDTTRTAPDGRGEKAKSFTVSLGEAYAQSDAYKGFIGKYAARGYIPTEAKGLQSSPFALPTLKDLVTGASDTSGGAFVRADQYGPVTDLAPQRPLVLEALVTRGTTGSDTVEYVRVTGRTNNAAAVAEATSAASNALAVPGGYKPQSALTVEKVATTVKTLAHWIPITKRAVADAPQMRTLIDSFLLTGLAEVKENEMLNGNGTDEHFTGINNTAGIQTYTPGLGVTDLDAVLYAVAQVRKTNRNPNALVIHPDDWYSDGFLTAKNSAGDYLVGDPRASIDQLNALWGMTAVVTTAQPAGTPLVGDFRQAVLWDREQANLAITDSHADFFTRNLLAILAEERAAFGVLDPQAFCRIES